MDVLGDAPPFMHHHDAGSLGFDRVVVYDEALHRGLAVRIGDRLFPNRSVCARDHCDGAKRSHYIRSHADLLRVWHDYIGMSAIPTLGRGKAPPVPSQAARNPFRCSLVNLEG